MGGVRKNSPKTAAVLTGVASRNRLQVYKKED